MALGVPGRASASLTVISGGMVHDTLTDLYWLQDLSAYVGLSYDDQLSALSLDTTGGYSWEIAWGEEMATLAQVYSPAEIRDAFSPSWESGDPDMQEVFLAHFQYEWQGQNDAAGKGFLFENGVLGNLGEFIFGTSWPYGDDPLKCWSGNIGIFNATDLTGVWAFSDGGTPAVPEPATVMQLGLGLFAIAGLGWRRHSRRSLA